MPSLQKKKTMLSLLCLSACVLLAAAPSKARSADAVPMQATASVELVLSEDPKDFYDAAASANLLEIEASKLAETKSRDEKVKDFARMMIKDHTETGTKLGQLATSKNMVLPTQLLKRHQLMLDGLKEKEDGAAFDEDYRMKMVTSHKEAVTLFEHASKKSADPDIRAFAAKVLPTLEAHGGQARKLEDAAKK